jgi:hypothetical protein
MLPDRCLGAREHLRRLSKSRAVRHTLASPAQLVGRTACQLPGKCVILGSTARWDALHCPKLSSVLGRAIVFTSIASGSRPVQTAALENDARPAGLAAGTAPPLRGSQLEQSSGTTTLRCSCASGPARSGNGAEMLRQSRWEFQVSRLGATKNPASPLTRGLSHRLRSHSVSGRNTLGSSRRSHHDP